MTCKKIQIHFRRENASQTKKNVSYGTALRCPTQSLERNRMNQYRKKRRRFESIGRLRIEIVGE